MINSLYSASALKGSIDIAASCGCGPINNGRVKMLVQQSNLPNVRPGTILNMNVDALLAVTVVSDTYESFLVKVSIIQGFNETLKAGRRLSLFLGADGLPPSVLLP